MNAYSMQTILKSNLQSYGRLKNFYCLNVLIKLLNASENERNQTQEDSFFCMNL